MRISPFTNAPKNRVFIAVVYDEGTLIDACVCQWSHELERFIYDMGGLTATGWIS